jgi:peptidoglycan/xylan/chitin deacetylase (PgdA/CDA1 family)
MAKPRFPCKYHPEEKTTRRCFYCREYICKSCQKLFAHHIFCSYGCIIKFFFCTYIIKKIKITRREIILFITFLGVQLILYLFLWLEITEYIDDQKKPAADRVPLTTQNMQFSLDSTIRINNYTIQISGNAPENSMIIVQHNGKFRSPSVLTQNGRFSFQSHPLFWGDNHFMVWALLTPEKEVLIDSISVSYYSKKVDLLARSVTRIPTNETIVALTFDAGSGAYGADSIIQILHDHALEATFFLTGRFIEKYPDIVQQLVGSNFELGNHTYSHPHLTQIEINKTQRSLPRVDRIFIRQQLNKADSVLFSKFNTHFMPYWRAPYGEYNQEILLWAAEDGYRHIRWSDQCDTWDYVTDIESPLYRSSQEIYYHLIELEQKGKLSGSIILMHLGSDRQSDFPYKMLKKFISYMKERGFKFLTISQLLGQV